MILSWWLAGLALGAFNGWTARLTTDRLQPGASHSVVAWVLGGMLLRWILAGGLLTAALQHGAVPGLLTFFGLWLARWGTVGRASIRVSERGSVIA
jgi:hypothetical protein